MKKYFTGYAFVSFETEKGKNYEIFKEKEEVLEKYQKKLIGHVKYEYHGSVLNFK